MMISQSHIDKLLAKLKAEPHYDDVMNIGLRNSYDKIYLVGGKVYRGLAEIIYEREMGFKECDWDILVMGKPQSIWLPPKEEDKRWRWTTSHYKSAFSLRCGMYKYKTGRRRAGMPMISMYIKMDIISIDDIKRERPGAKDRGGTLDDYFWGVPLNIQAIALNLDSESVRGPGVSAIMSKRIEINNKFGTIFDKNEDPSYVRNLLADKAGSMGFEYTLKDSSKKCTCFLDDPRLLLHFGCRCGGI